MRAALLWGLLATLGTVLLAWATAAGVGEFSGRADALERCASACGEVPPRITKIAGEWRCYCQRCAEGPW